MEAAWLPDPDKTGTSLKRLLHDRTPEFLRRPGHVSLPVP
jgi:hypothetical protein